MEAIKDSLFKPEHNPTVRTQIDAEPELYAQSFTVKVDAKDGGTAAEYDSAAQDSALTAQVNRATEGLLSEVRYCLSLKEEVIAVNRMKIALLTPLRKLRFPPPGEAAPGKAKSPKAAPKESTRIGETEEFDLAKMRAAAQGKQMTEEEKKARGLLYDTSKATAVREESSDDDDDDAAAFEGGDPFDGL